jgi:hypothetical protein
MKNLNAITVALLAGLVHAHSGVWTITVDGIRYVYWRSYSLIPLLTYLLRSYPARDARMDGRLGAKRVEWGFSDSGGRTWGPVENVNDQALACKRILILYRVGVTNML